MLNELIRGGRGGGGASEQATTSFLYLRVIIWPSKVKFGIFFSSLNAVGIKISKKSPFSSVTVFIHADARIRSQ